MHSIPHLLELQQRLAQSRPADTGAAQQVVDEYFRCFSPGSANNQLWCLLAAAISNELDEQTGAQRHDLIFFFEYTQLLITAAHQLQQARKRAT